MLEQIAVRGVPSGHVPSLGYPVIYLIRPYLEVGFARSEMGPCQRKQMQNMFVSSNANALCICCSLSNLQRPTDPVALQSIESARFAKQVLPFGSWSLGQERCRTWTVRDRRCVSTGVEVTGILRFTRAQTRGEQNNSDTRGRPNTG